MAAVCHLGFCFAAHSNDMFVKKKSFCFHGLFCSTNMVFARTTCCSICSWVLHLLFWSDNTATFSLTCQNVKKKKKKLKKVILTVVRNISFLIWQLVNQKKNKIIFFCMHVFVLQYQSIDNAYHCNFFLKILWNSHATWRWKYVMAMSFTCILHCEIEMTLSPNTFLKKKRNIDCVVIVLLCLFRHIATLWTFNCLSKMILQVNNFLLVCFCFIRDTILTTWWCC